MSRPMNNVRTSTPISILKIQKIRMRRFAEADKKRKGNESDSIVLEKILQYYEQHHPVISEPLPTYTN